MRLAAFLASLVVLGGSAYTSTATAPTGSDPADAIAAQIKAGDHAAAATAARALLATLEAAGETDTLREARLLDLLVEASWRGELNGPPAAETADGARAVQIRERISGPDDPNLATSLHLLGNLLQGRSDPRGARAAYERSLAIRERVFGPDALEVVPSLNNLGNVTRQAGDLKASRQVLERALAIREARLSAGDRAIDVSRRSLGMTLRDLGEFAEAERQLRLAVLGAEQRSGQDILLADALNDLATVLIQSGRPEEADGPLRRALEIREQLAGADDPALGGYVSNLAVLRRDLGDFAEARQLQERALRIVESSGRAPPAYVALMFDNLGYLFLATGDPEGAVPILERALEILRRTHSADSPDTARTLTNLGHASAQRGDPVRARDYYLEALAIHERSVGPRHMDYALALHNLGMAERDMGRYAEAQRLFEQSTRILEEALGARAKETGLTLKSLAGTQLLLGKPAEARRSFEQAYSILEAALGPAHPDVADALTGLARGLAATGDTAQALDAALRAEALATEFVRLTIPVLPERQALALAANRSAGLDVALTIATRSREHGVVRRAWDAVIRSRGIVLDEVARRVAVTTRFPDERVAALREQLVAARNRLVRLHVRNVEPAAIVGHREELDLARREKERLEQALAEASAPFRRDLALARAGYDEISAALPPDTALVAYVSFDDGLRRPAAAATGEFASGAYAAFVFAPDGSEPRLVSLGPSAATNTLVARWRDEATAPALAGSRRGDDERYRKAGEALRRAIWDPVRAKLGGASRVFVVPDSALNLVSLAALPDSRGRYLVESGPTIHLLTAERDLLRLAHRPPGGSGLLAIGAPDFDAGPGSAAVHATAAARDTTLLRTAMSRGGATRFESLPGTREEADRVSVLWREQVRSEPEALEITGAEATEAAFKAGAPGKRVLHVATHGFFLAPDRSRNAGLAYGDFVPGRWTEAEQGRVSADNPLLLSGLALAGANRRLAEDGEPGADDGLLVAEEIASLDLNGVEWAVFSACETGLGEFVPGEGIVGLRRAALVAGVRTVVMSLWRVDDAATREFIEGLYRARFGERLATAEAATAAHRGVIAARRREGRSTHPFYWGAFVAAGDWR